MLLRHGVVEERDEHIDMTPMVDVVFQLMTFMLFAMQITGAAKADVPVAVHGVGIPETDVTVLTLVPSQSDPKGVVFLGDGVVEMKTGQPKAPVSPSQIKDEIAKNFALGRKRVIIQASGEVSHGDLLDLAAVVAEVPGVSIHIGVKEPQ